MKSVRTRFQPTLATGNLHFGHFVNLVIAHRYARDTGGVCYAVPVLSFNEEECAINCYRNLAIMKDLFLELNMSTPLLTIDSAGVCCNMQVVYLKKFLEEQGFEAPANILSHRAGDLLNLTLHDYILETNLFIRGRDWLSGQLKVDGMLKRQMLEGMMKAAGKEWELKEVHHPLVIGSNKRKISKSTPGDGACDIARIFVEVKNPHLTSLIYVLSLFENGIVYDEYDSLENYKIDLDKVCAMDDFKFDLKVLKKCEGAAKKVLDYVQKNRPFVANCHYNSQIVYGYFLGLEYKI